MIPGLKILYLEDDENDVFFFKDTLYRLNFEGQLYRARDVDEAVDCLRESGPAEPGGGVLVPNLIVTDLKMPGLNGIEFIRWVRERPEFNDVPVFIFSSSRSERDRAAGAAAGARCYFNKPGTLAEWRQVVYDILGCGMGLFVCGPDRRLQPVVS